MIRLSKEDRDSATSNLSESNAGFIPYRKLNGYFKVLYA
jgi:hypothetical protein